MASTMICRRKASHTVSYLPVKIHKLELKKLSASPQRTPVLFQAGSSAAGKLFAARHAEAIFSGGSKPSDLTELIKEVRAMAVKEGRDPYDVKFFPNLTPILGATYEEAKAKHDKWIKNADWEGGLACVSGFTGYVCFFSWLSTWKPCEVEL
jgi:alkanesulfonate monooxygenase SsuD/methylene tetrahydromethanopterin reductase-like flavin-dependent oxidoreductase (luciferase family)